MKVDARSEIEERINYLLSSELSVDLEQLANSDAATPLLGHGIGLDSIEVMALALGIEREFDVQIPDQDLTVELFKNLGTLTDYVLAKTK